MFLGRRSIRDVSQCGADQIPESTDLLDLLVVPPPLELKTLRIQLRTLVKVVGASSDLRLRESELRVFLRAYVRTVPKHLGIVFFAVLQSRVVRVKAEPKLQLATVFPLLRKMRPDEGNDPTHLLVIGPDCRHTND